MLSKENKELPFRLGEPKGCVYNVLQFEWDENKNSINKVKHGVSFEEAETAFYDDDAVVINDPEHSQEEERFILLGFSAMARMLMVCHCVRGDDDVIRIISARKANRREIDQYTEKEGY